MAKMTIPDIGNVQPTKTLTKVASTPRTVASPGGPTGLSGRTLGPAPDLSGIPNAAPQTAPQTSIGDKSYGVGTGVGGGGGGSFGLDAPQMTDVDYLAGDSGYQGQLAALMKALEDYRADTTAQGSRYDVDYGKGLKSLGWNDLDGDFATADGEWDLDDPNTAAGRGFTSQRNDFASRGMLQSSDYGRANDLLMRNLNDQRSSMETGRNRFTQDLASQLSAFENENNSAQQSARNEALMRRAAPWQQL